MDAANALCRQDTKVPKRITGAEPIGVRPRPYPTNHTTIFVVSQGTAPSVPMAKLLWRSVVVQQMV